MENYWTLFLSWRQGLFVTYSLHIIIHEWGILKIKRHYNNFRVNFNIDSWKKCKSKLIKMQIIGLKK